MEILKFNDIFKTPPVISLLGGEYFAKFLMYILRFNKLNKIYEQIASKKGIEFIDEIISVLEFKIDIDENELKRIPQSGPVIIVANHPFGGLDGMLLIKYISSIRPDIKVAGNFLFQKVKPVSDYFINDYPLKNSDADNGESIGKGAEEAANHLQSGGVLCLFPANDLSTYGTFDNITDQIWQISVINFIKDAKVPVLPVYFQGTNSRLFHLAAKIHPSLRQVRLPSELLSKKHKTIKMRIGALIRTADQDKFDDIYQFGRFLRAKTYSMESPIEVKRLFSYNLKPQLKPENIIEPVPKAEILKELEDIKTDYTLFNLRNYTA